MIGQTEIGRARLRRLNISVPAHLQERDTDAENAVCSKYIHFSDPDAFRAMEGRFGEAHLEECREYFKAMALCHAALRNEAELGEDGLGSLSAASPDELPLVEAAAMFGYVFEKRQKNRVRLQLPDGSKADYEVIQELEFTSERRRMGVIVKDLGSNQITLYLEFADLSAYKKLLLVQFYRTCNVLF